jgi:hypothetical protein
MRAPSCCSERSSVWIQSCVLCVAKMRWFTEEGGLLVVMAALQIGHELHGCLVSFILL